MCQKHWGLPLLRSCFSQAAAAAAALNERDSHLYTGAGTTQELPKKGGTSNGAVSFYKALFAVYQKDQQLLSGMQVNTGGV